MNADRNEAIAALLTDHAYTGGAGTYDRFIPLNGRVLTSADPHVYGVEMRFDGQAEPEFIMGDWIVVHDNGTVELGGWNSLFPLIFRLVPGADKQAAASQMATDINSRFSRT